MGSLACSGRVPGHLPPAHALSSVLFRLSCDTVWPLGTQTPARPTSSTPGCGTTEPRPCPAQVPHVTCLPWGQPCTWTQHPLPRPAHEGGMQRPARGVPTQWALSQVWGLSSSTLSQSSAQPASCRIPEPAWAPSWWAEWAPARPGRLGGISWSPVHRSLCGLQGRAGSRLAGAAGPAAPRPAHGASARLASGWWGAEGGLGLGSNVSHSGPGNEPGRPLGASRTQLSCRTARPRTPSHSLCALKCPA